MKKKLRKEAKLKLSQISDKDKESLDFSLSQNLKSFLHDQHLLNELVGVFDPIQKEPCWFKQLNLAELNLCFPHLIEENQMNFYSIEASETLELGIGLEDSAVAGKEIVQPKVLLIPGLAFDTKGARLGRGKGFYDRYLSNFKGTSIALAYECQLVDELPEEEHDKKIDYLITEKNIYGPNN